MVLGLCRLLLRDPVEAEDASQQAFLSAHQALLRGSAPRDRSAWMAAIARNECRARIRARTREPLALPELPSDLPDPLAAAIRAADLRAVWLALGTLPRRQRNALVLRELGGLSYHELGRALGVSHSAIESLLFRARERVRAFLASTSAVALPAAWKLAGTAVSVGVVVTGAGELHTERHPVAPRRFFAAPVARHPSQPARRAVRVSEPVPLRAPIVRTPDVYRPRPVRSAPREGRSQTGEHADRPEQEAPPASSAPDPVEPAQLDQVEVESHSGSDSGSDDGGSGRSGSEDGGPD
jgi:RNA polymerase sigma-70 factor (ECF subfamily)